MSRPNTQRRPTAGRTTSAGKQPADGKKQGANITAQSRTSQTARGSRLAKSFIESHRMVASGGLVLLILLTLFAPLSTQASNPTPLLTPRVDGTNSVITGVTSKDLESMIFPYKTVIERNQENLELAWPDVSDVLNFEPSSQEARRAIVGQVFASSTGSLEIRVKNSGLEANPDRTKLNSLAITYQDMDDTDKAQNGLAMLSMLVSLTSSTLEIRYNREREAVLGFQQAANDNPDVWQYTYNWGLANFLTGNYLSAYEAMRTVVDKDETKDFALIRFWMGLSALRMGEPDEAITLLNQVVTAQLAPDAAENVANSFYEARDLAQEALGDAQWARRDPATAYKTYYDALFSGKATYNLYRKWLRLGLEQHAYERMLSDMAALASSGGLAKDFQGRIHHDRGRLLSFLGRESEAQSEYQTALSINGQDDAPLLISYSQSLLARGDTDGALAQSETALRILAKDLSAGDMVSVANTVLTTTASLAARDAAQETMDAHLVRAMAWSKQNKSDLIDSLVTNITAGADSQPAAVGGLLYLYGGYAYEAAAQAVTGDASAALYSKAADTYGKAWALLDGLGAGQPGRAAALAGQARASALASGKTTTDGINVLKAGGYDPVTISPTVSNDVDAGELLYQGALLLEAGGQEKEAANAYRVAGIILNLQDAENFSGVGRPLWMGNGTPVPAIIALRTGDALRRAPGGDLSQAVFRYKQAYLLSPALAPAWNNLGVLYSQMGNPAAQAYLELAGKASPAYVLGDHNLAAAAYKAGIGNFFTAEDAQASAIKAIGPDSLRWGYNLRYDERDILPASDAPALDFWVKAGALPILLLLLLHTLVGNDRMTNRMGLIPTRGVIGRLAVLLDVRLKTVFPRLVSPGSATRNALLTSILIPAVIGMLGLAWAAGHGSWEVALVFLPVAFVMALLAFGVNEAAQRWVAGKAGASTLHHIWPMGILLGIVSIPFGFMYGWQNVTRLTTADGGMQATEGGGNIRKARTAEESDLLYEVQTEAAADTGDAPALEAVPVGSSSVVSVRGSGWFNLSPAARIMFAGTLANLALAVVFGVIYWLMGWPSMRLGLFATMLVLAFTSVSEPPADGWTLYRRNAPLWLAVFLFAATIVTLLAVGAI